jgi:hypothetical protein
MKSALFALLLVAGPFVLRAADLPEHLEDLVDEYSNQMAVWGVNDDDFEDEYGKEYLVIKFCSRQDDSNTQRKPKYRMRFTAQVTDNKTKTVVVAQAEKGIRVVHDMNSYTGRTEWEFRIPFGKMKKPKLTAYAVEFGLIEGGAFVPVAVDYKHADSAEEILLGEGQRGSLECTRSKHMWYNSN